MKTLFLTLGFVVVLTALATLKGHPGVEATTLTDVTTLKGRPTSVTVTLVRWPFT